MNIKAIWNRQLIINAIAIFVGSSAAGAAAEGIRIDPDNPRYWNYKNERVLLIGGSVEDNLFQINGLEEHLDLLVASGGNYVRNTMSSRDEGNVWPFLQGFATDGRPVDDLSSTERLKDPLGSWSVHDDSVYPKYDLNAFNDTYWKRFEAFLALTQERGIIVQLEIWDRFDYGRDPWLVNPFNPVNNINYNSGRSRLMPAYPEHPGENRSMFFRSVPELQMNFELLGYQESFVEKLLSISLRFDNVLYTISNETSTDEAWSAYWATFLREAAAKADKTIFITEMWDPWNLDNPMHNRTFDHPELYDFVDVSQNNHQKGQAHWDNLIAQWYRLAGEPRPMNNVKIYGANGGRFSTTDEAIDRFWRSIIGGSASARFHRSEQNFGLGLRPIAQAQLLSARELLARVDLTEFEPKRAALLDNEPNEAFLAGGPNDTYIIYFPSGGDVMLPTDQSSRLKAQWLNVDATTWTVTSIQATKAGARLATPTAEERWIALIRPDLGDVSQRIVD